MESVDLQPIELGRLEDFKRLLYRLYQLQATMSRQLSSASTGESEFAMDDDMGLIKPPLEIPPHALVLITDERNHSDGRTYFNTDSGLQNCVPNRSLISALENKELRKVIITGAPPASEHRESLHTLFICSLSLNLNLDPVAAPSSGQSFDSSQISIHLSRQANDPLNRQKLLKRDLLPNLILVDLLKLYAQNDSTILCELDEENQQLNESIEDEQSKLTKLQSRSNKILGQACCYFFMLLVIYTFCVTSVVSPPARKFFYSDNKNPLTALLLVLLLLLPAFILCCKVNKILNARATYVNINKETQDSKRKIRLIKNFFDDVPRTLQNHGECPIRIEP